MKQISSKEIVETPPKASQTTRIFDEFFIIGVDKDELAKLDWNSSQR
jgi:hypothetical protein